MVRLVRCGLVNVHDLTPQHKSSLNRSPANGESRSPGPSGEPGTRVVQLRAVSGTREYSAPRVRILLLHPAWRTSSVRGSSVPSDKWCRGILRHYGYRL